MIKMAHLSVQKGQTIKTEKGNEQSLHISLGDYNEVDFYYDFRHIHAKDSFFCISSADGEGIAGSSANRWSLYLTRDEALRLLDKLNEELD
jgi:hypothetical protein